MAMPQCGKRRKELLLGILVLKLIILSAGGTRVRVGPPEEDPSTAQVHNDLRHLITSANYFYSEQAGVHPPEASTYVGLLEGVKIEDREQFLKNHFKFNSSEFIRRSISYRWLGNLDERLALHVYDDPKEMKLAKGPRVDQDLCGLHLSYMIHMVEKHNQHMTTSTDLSLFRIMNAFDFPHRGLADGNTIFPGSYDSCISTELSLIKRELVEILNGNTDEAELWFSRSRRMTSEQKSDLGLSKSHWIRMKTFLWEHMQMLKPLLSLTIRDPLKQKSFDPQARDKVHTIGTRFCMAGLRWPNWSNNSWSRRHMTVRVGTCLPESCDSESLGPHRDKLLNLISRQTNQYHSGFYIENLYCLPDEASEIRDPLRHLGTLLFIGFLILWTLITIVASYMFWKNGKWLESECAQTWWSYLKSWCIQTNLSSFFDTAVRAPPNANNAPASGTASLEKSHTISRVRRNYKTIREDDEDEEQEEQQEDVRQELDLASIEGLKVLGSISVMMSHVAMLVITRTSSPLITEMRDADGFNRVSTICPAIVNVFFVITGSMTVRTLARVVRAHSPSFMFWINFVLYRYVRVIPLYLVIHLFLQHAFRFMGHGPFWDYGTSHSSWSHSCQSESIWRILLPTANFISPSIHCNGVGWYVANDIQLTMLVPIIVPLLIKRPRLGHFFIGIACILGTLSHIRYFYINETDPRGLFEWTGLGLGRVTDDTMPGYIYPQYRFVAYFVGLSLGQLLDSYEQKSIARFPKALYIFGKWYFYLLFYILAIVPALTPLVLNWDVSSLKLLVAIFSGSSHLLAAISFSGLIICLTTGNFNQTITRFLSSNFITQVAKMAHSTSLVHLPLMFYHQQTSRSLPSIVTAYDMMRTTVVWLSEAFVLSFIVHILFEVPLRRFLIKVLLAVLSPRKKEDKKKETRTKSATDKKED